MFIDTHCHLDDSSLRDRLPDVLAAATVAGVGRFIVPGVEPKGWDDVMALAAGDPRILAAPGVHPLWADRCNDEALCRLETLCREAVAIGEIGLDYTCEDVPREVQQKTLRAQLRLAVTKGLPVLIHCRRAFQDLLLILREEGAERVGGVMHAFSGSVEIAEECIKLGFFISIAGTVTYDNAVRPLELVRRIPLDHLVLETDAPDMTPEPYRGRPNEPAFLVETAKKVAAIKGVSLEAVAAVTTANAERVFKL
ncbi:TatD family hydrolase [Geobacter sp. AOG1]|uniref:TatD family hydrolase n=1 Tax=Geobacter sp. AOG1 TaxID=1566346 RepID=UPI001CC66CDA|nr:TatD family hydrolase [Geobacter sp. AOG1]GFE56629.1 TatD family hydrolase [Geobacter sp. AOG1]